VETEVSKRTNIWCLVSTPDQLRRIAAAMEQEVGRVGEAVRKEQEEADGSLASYGRSAVDPEPQVTVASKDGVLRYSGTLSEILPEIDHRPLGEFSMSMRIHPPYSALGPSTGVTLKLKNEMVGPAGHLRVEGTDHTWVAGLHSLLDDELKTAIPWWAIFRRPIGIALVSVIAYLLTAFPLTLIPQVIPTPVFALALVVVVGSPWAVLRVIPAFEILDAGERPQAERRMAALAVCFGLLLTIAGILIGLFTSAP